MLLLAASILYLIYGWNVTRGVPVEEKIEQCLAIVNGVRLNYNSSLGKYYCTIAT